MKMSGGSESLRLSSDVTEKVDNAHAAQVSYKVSWPLVLRYPVD